MVQTTTGYKLIKKIKDEKFEEENLHAYCLLLQYSNRDLQVGVTDENNKLLFFEDFVFNELESRESLFELLKDLFVNHAILTAGFWKEVVFSVKNNQFAQVPSQLFEEKVPSKYLEFNVDRDEKDAVLWCPSLDGESVTVFCMDKEIHKWVKSMYSRTTVSFVHQSVSLIAGVSKASIAENSPLYIYVDRFKLHILSFAEGKLIYYNQFPIKQFSDYVKYIMLVISMLKLDQKTSRVILWGYIGKNSAHYQEFYKYISNVEFGSRPDHLRYGYLFDEVQDHGYLDLLSLNLFSK